MKKNRRKGGLVATREKGAYAFVAHYIVGLILFFAVPIINSIRYAFSDVAIGGVSGIDLKFVGLEHFKYILKTDPNFTNNLRDSFTSIMYQLPVIIALSLILAVILNKKFVGRTLARAVFFLPVIIASAVVMGVLNSQYVQAPLFVMKVDDSGYGTGLIDFTTILQNLNMPDQINTVINNILGNVFGIIWSCGVQIILFLSGLQSIPDSMYEVSKIEGANAWEEFWFITVPMLRHVITLVIIYTMIELFTSTDNPVMTQAYGLMKDRQVYDSSSAMLWLYFLMVVAVIGILLLAYNKFCMKKWE